MTDIGTAAGREFPATELAGPAADGVDQGYWDGLRDGELRLQRCPSCDVWIWGPRWMCGKCHAFELEWAPVPAWGRVYSWSRSWHPFIPALAAELPYVTVLVELPDAGGRRVLGLLAEADTAGIAIGDEVVGVIQQPGDAAWPVLRWQRTRQGQGLAEEGEQDHG